MGFSNNNTAEIHGKGDYFWTEAALIKALVSSGTDPKHAETLAREKVIAMYDSYDNYLKLKKINDKKVVAKTSMETSVKKLASLYNNIKKEVDNKEARQEYNKLLLASINRGVPRPIAEHEANLKLIEWEQKTGKKRNNFTSEDILDAISNRYPELDLTGTHGYNLLVDMLDAQIPFREAFERVKDEVDKQNEIEDNLSEKEKMYRDNLDDEDRIFAEQMMAIQPKAWSYAKVYARTHDEEEIENLLVSQAKSLDDNEDELDNNNADELDNEDEGDEDNENENEGYEEEE
jgi:hypothetical protein